MKRINLEKLLNVYNSNDSVIAMFLSLLFNYLLSLLSSTKVKDMTSGFIIGPKKEFKKTLFLKQIMVIILFI